MSQDSAAAGPWAKRTRWVQRFQGESTFRETNPLIQSITPVALKISKIRSLVSLEIVLVVILVLVLILVLELELELDFQRWNRRLRMAPRQQRFWGVFQLSGHAAHNPGWDRSQCERESFNL